MQGQSSRRYIATQSQPCQVCGAPDKCVRTGDDLFICRKSKVYVAGFRHLGAARNDPEWHLYRSESDPRLYGPNDDRGQLGGEEGRKGGGAETGQHLTQEQQAGNYAKELSSHWREMLARHLQLPEACFGCLPLLGFRKADRDGPCWTYPEHFADGTISGIVRRWPDGSKKMLLGGKRGLILPSQWGQLDGPLYIVEGMTDVLALRAMHLDAIGRSHDLGGVPLLAILLAQLPAEKKICVLGEHDTTDKGEWPGRDGAVAASRELSKLLSRPVQWALPPGRAKDARRWFTERDLAAQDSDSIDMAGEEFAAALRMQADTPLTEEHDTTIVLRSMDTVDDEVLSYLVPKYFPQGKLMMLSGDGGLGKSFVTLGMAAALSRGECCFGLSYPALPPMHTVIANCEDGQGDTIKPRLRALGADLSKIHLIEGTKDKKGKVSPFSLAHIEPLRRKLQSVGNVGLVIIDPVTAYLSSTGVDDFRDSSLREGILEPLREMARVHNCCTLMILHLNKGESSKARNRVAGNLAYTNACRGTYMVMQDPENAAQKLFMPDKINFSANPPGLIYRITRVGPSLEGTIMDEVGQKMSGEDQAKYREALFFAEWIGETDNDVNSVCSADNSPPEQNYLEAEKAAGWLRKYLANGPRPATDCIACGNDHLQTNNSPKWWRNAVLKAKVGGESRKAGMDQGWLWCLPGQRRPAAAKTEEAEHAEEAEGAEEAHG